MGQKRSFTMNIAEKLVLCVAFIGIAFLVIAYVCYFVTKKETLSIWCMSKFHYCFIGAFCLYLLQAVGLSILEYYHVL